MNQLISKLRQLFCILLLGLISFSVFCQNLVPNSSFEDHYWPPSGHAHFRTAVIDWGGYLTVDIHVGDLGATGMNFPELGYQQPFHGEAMAGIRAFDFREYEWHEFMYTMLEDSLIEGEMYFVSFWVSPNEAPKYVTDDIGLYFSKTDPPEHRLDAFDFKPQIENPEGNYLDDVTAWYEISGYYKAEGGERYIFIGNFKKDSETSFKESGGTGEEAAYFFVDYVTVEKCPTPICVDLRDTTLCGGEELLLNVTNPDASYLWNDGSESAEYTIETAGKYWVEVSAGGCTISDTINVKTIPAINLGDDVALCEGETTQLNATLLTSIYQWNDNTKDSILEVSQTGLYSVIVENDRCIFHDTVAVNYLNENIVFHPNPNNGTFTINTNLGPIDWLTIHDVSGRLLFEIKEKQEAIFFVDLKDQLFSGLYFVTISSNDCVVTEKIVVSKHD